MKNIKAKIAAGLTVIALGGLTGLALSQGKSATSNTVADKPVVRTKVIRRTIHVTKHVKPKHPPASTPVGPGSGAPSAVTASSGAPETAPVSTASSGSAGAESAPVTTSSSGATESAPVTTASSGAGGGGGGGEVEHEGGGDD